MDRESMTVRPIVIYPDPRLRQPTQNVLLPTATQNQLLVRDLIDTMYAYEGIGIAAPQIGVPANVFIVDLASMKTTDFSYFNIPQRIDLKKPLAFINPTFVEETTDVRTEEEGCLSFPGIALKVSRGSQAVIRATNADGNNFELGARGLLARCILHENDHINGKLFVDYVSHMKKQMVAKKLQR